MKNLALLLFILASLLALADAREPQQLFNAGSKFFRKFMSKKPGSTTQFSR